MTAEAAPSLPESYRLTNDAQRTLLRDMPVVALWDYINAAGRSAAVRDVTISWNGLPNYDGIVKG
jgi:oligopeptide transport system substrate-binding protein